MTPVVLRWLDLAWRRLLLQHVVALSFLQLGKHAADELARAGLSKPWAGAASFGSWYRGCAYKRLVSATAAHETATASATAVEKQIGGFSFPADGGGGGLDAEAWGSASLAKQSGAGGALESLASSMAKAEAASAAGAGRDASSSRPPAAAFAVAMGALTVAAWLVVFIADSGSGAQFWALSIALSPVGAVLRYTLGLKNGSGPWGADFPWGTAAANILGSGFSCLCCTCVALGLIHIYPTTVSCLCALSVLYVDHSQLSSAPAAVLAGAVILSVQSSKASELAALGVTGTALQDAIAADNSDTYLLILHAVATGLCVRLHCYAPTRTRVTLMPCLLAFKLNTSCVRNCLRCALPPLCVRE
jgi:fluoride ion exporter CrcB/FEX